jgi:hypothetical protein
LGVAAYARCSVSLWAACSYAKFVYPLSLEKVDFSHLPL